MTKRGLSSKFKIIAITFSCFTLMGCPLRHFYSYQYVGEKLLNEDGKFSALQRDNTNNLFIECGFYYQFIKDKERELIAQLSLDKDYGSVISDIKVQSSKLGELEISQLPKMENNYTAQYKRPIDIKRENKILKLLTNDTTTISFAKSKRYFFVRQ
ncbi:MAG: hypothetical protein WBG71_06535 [Leeuwenhoekiella sp.]